jgi:peptidyl-prolyl cis-trans isomerase SurA
MNPFVRKLPRAALVCLLALPPISAARAAVIEEIVAQVNGKIITRTQLLEREKQVMAQVSARLVGDELDAAVDRARRTLLTDMIREEVLLQRAEILGLELDKVYQQALNQLKENQGIRTQEELDEVLKSEGLSREELRETLLRYNVPEIMINLEVRDKIAVTEDEISSYFSKHKDQFRIDESFTVSEIVLTEEGRTSEQLRELASKVEAELKAGAKFNEMVVKYSQAPSRFNDGKIGPVPRGDLATDIEKAAEALKPGEVSPPLRTRAGYHIIRLEEHVERQEPTIENSRQKITSLLKQEKFSADLRRFFNSLMETNLIKVNPNYKQYDDRSVDPVS